MQDTSDNPNDLFTQAEWYDRTINWPARLEREIPVLTDVLGPPGGGGIVDAGCGTGHQACALAGNGYRVVGVDASEEMLTIAERTTQAAQQQVRFVLAPYTNLVDEIGGGFDGVYCLGNALAAAGTREAVSEAVAQFARCLRRGGRLFIQLLNFPPMRLENPCVRGPRAATANGVEYISVRHFVFVDDALQVTNVTLWRDPDWNCRTHTGALYPVCLDQLQSWCRSSGLRIDETWGGYDRQAYDTEKSTDLLVVGTRL